MSVHFGQFKIFNTLEVLGWQPSVLQINFIILRLAWQNWDLVLIIVIAICSKSANNLSKFYICLITYRHIPGASFLLLYIVFESLISTSSKNGEVRSRKWEAKILITILTNCVTKFVAPWAKIVICIRPKGVINPVRSRDSSSNST